MKAKITPIFYIFAILLLAACGQENPTAQPLPTATAIALQKLNLANHELLTDPRVAIACDSGEGATIECARDGLHWQLAIDSTPSTFARFSLRFAEVETPLQGTETLLLRATFESQERPYLYLVQADGKRIATPIDFFKPRSDPTVLAFPLSEIHDENGNVPDFSTVNEVQLVFEYGEFHQKVTVESLQFAPVWSHSAAVSANSQALAEKLTLPEGFVAEAIADHMHQMTQIVFTDQGDMLVSLQEGQIWWYSGRNPDGSYQNRHLWAAGFEEVVGLLYDPNDGAVWIGGRGKLYYTRDSGVDGVADIREVRIEGLPWGRHQNNSLTWNPDPDPFTGEAGGTWLYFGLGSTDDLVVGGERNATVLRFPRTGSSANDLQIVSRGNRNAYTVLWANMPDDLSDPGSDPNSAKS